MFHRPAVDLLSNNFYAVKPYYPDTSYICSVDIKSHEYTELCSISPDFNITVNPFFGAVFDSYNNKYIAILYLNDIYDKKIAIFDIYSGAVDTVPCSFQPIFQFIDYDPKPILKLINDTLVGSYSDTYTWYCNDTILPNEDSRRLKPVSTGDYMFSTLNFAGDIVFSNEVFVEVLNSAIDNSTHSEFSIYPNPVNDNLFLNLDIRKNNYTYRIYSTKGLIVKEGVLENRKSHQINP